MEASELTQLSEDLIHRLGAGGDLEGVISAEMYPQNNLYMEEDDNEPDDVIILHMDIREPLSTLRKLLEQKTGVTLNGYKFWLQDAQELEPHKNLVDQCVKGEGLVQINVQIQTIVQRINIVDVLKPTEAALAALAAEEAQKSSKSSEVDESLQDEDSQDSVVDEKRALDLKTHSKTASAEKPCLNWVLDSKFKREQVRLKIPEDPNDWTVAQVTHWFQWAVRQFDLAHINMSDWAITGSKLCALTHEEFRKKLPRDPGNVFWTHLQLLKECKFVSVVHNIAEISPHHSRFSAVKSDDSQKELKIMRKPSIYGLKNFSPLPGDVSPYTAATTYSTHGVGSGNNGQVQLWQFLLEILTDRQHSDIIQWVGTEGEFKLSDPEKVARLWGVKKNKPAMNYEKLSRALRYYYDGDMISKVSGKRFAYKFDCDLKLLIGYNAAELSALVNERTFLAESHFMDHSHAKIDEE